MRPNRSCTRTRRTSEVLIELLGTQPTKQECIEETKYGQARARRWSCDDKGLIQLDSGHLSMTLRPWRAQYIKETKGRHCRQLNQAAAQGFLQLICYEVDIWCVPGLHVISISRSMASSLSYCDAMTEKALLNLPGDVKKFRLLSLNAVVT